MRGMRKMVRSRCQALQAAMKRNMVRRDSPCSCSTWGHVQVATMPCWPLVSAQGHHRCQTPAVPLSVLSPPQCLCCEQANLVPAVFLTPCPP